MLYALEAAHGGVELTADASIGTGGKRSSLGASCGTGGQRDAATHGQLFHQHAPALADVGRATDDEVERHEYVVTVDGAVLERDVQRQVASANVDACRVARNERHGNATVLPAAQQAVRVEQAEGQTDDGGNGRQRDVALREVQLQTDDLAAFPLAAAHDAGIGQ